MTNMAGSMTPFIADWRKYSVLTRVRDVMARAVSSALQNMIDGSLTGWRRP